MSSHQLSDVESVCDRVAIINRGKIVKIGTMEDLLHEGRTVITLDKVSNEILDKIKPLSARISHDGERVKIYVESDENVHKVIDLSKGNSTLISVLPQRQSLEDLFVETVRGANK